MNASIELNLALILFLPWYAILACLYWLYPRQPRTLSRKVFDVASLAVALLATVLSMHWGMRNGDKAIDPMWPQVLATAISYGAFLAVMTAAFFIRRKTIVAPHLARMAASEPSAPGSANP